MSYKISAGVKFDNKTELIIEADPDGNVERVYNIIDKTDYIAPDGLGWLGVIPEPVAEYSDVISISDTGFSSWTPSTTAGTINAEATLGTVDIEPDKYDYIAVIKSYTRLNYPSLEAKCLTDQMQINFDYLSAYPDNYTDFIAGTDNNVSINNRNSSGTIYTTSATDKAYIAGNNLGVYLNAAAFTSYSSGVLTIKRPALMARCNTTYFSTTEAARVDAATSFIKYDLQVYRVKKNTTDYGEMRAAAREIYMENSEE